MALAIGSLACIAAGCGSHSDESAAALALERQDLAEVTRSLRLALPSVQVELAASRRAWPYLIDGLPLGSLERVKSLVRDAYERSRRVLLPPLFEEAEGDASSLTGPGSGLAGLFRSYYLLAQRGWQLIGAAIDEVEHGSGAAATFARANVALYIESIYDAHFTLSQIGKGITRAYQKLGGPAAFGALLDQADVEQLEAAYSEASERLRPHERVRLGS